MKFDWIDPDRGPTPKQLGAYADGELTDADRNAVDAWLRRRPADAEEVDALRRVAQLWRDTPPPEPGPEAWSAVRAGIERGLSRSKAPATVPVWSLSRLGLLTAAAAVLVVFFLSKDRWPTATPAEEPYPVVDAEDVSIMSTGGDDCACLVCAQPPIGRIDEGDLAMPDDVLVLNLEEHQDGTVAECFEDHGPLLITPPTGRQREP